MFTTQTQTQIAESTPSMASVTVHSAPAVRKPLISSGLLSKYGQYAVTPVLGIQFEDLQLSQLLKEDNADELIKELAILVSQKNVAFFKNQDLTIEDQKILAQRLGELSGKPSDSTLHVHPITEDTSELGDEVSIISSDRKVAYPNVSKLASVGWHTDITFEPVPSDFAILKIVELPETGGDTLWASSYEAYDRLSPAYQKFLEGLTAVHEGKIFHTVAANVGFSLREGTRGSPANSGPALEAIHPVVRTNPITGWKGLFVNRAFTKRIVELTKDESDEVLNYLYKIVSENHDLQVRYKWSKNDIAIWSNQSSFHTATWDYSTRRIGNRVVSIGEKPYLDPSSISRRQALGLPAF